MVKETKIISLEHDVLYPQDSISS